MSRIKLDVTKSLEKNAETFFETMKFKEFQASKNI